MIREREREKLEIAEREGKQEGMVERASGD